MAETLLSFEDGIAEFVRDGLMDKEEAEALLTTFALEPEGSFVLPEEPVAPPDKDGLPLIDRDYVAQQVAGLSAEEIADGFLRDDIKGFAKRLKLKGYTRQKEAVIAKRIIDALQAGDGA